MLAVRSEAEAQGPSHYCLYMGRARRWEPVLDGSSRERALEASYTIGESLRERAVEEPSLARGKAGLAILYTYLAKVRSGCGDAETALRFLDQAADAVSATRMGAFFFGGFTGVAWAIAHLEGRLLDSDGEDPNEAVDEALKVHLRQSPWRGDYDLISGLVGFGVYALERLPSPLAAECLEQVVDRLDELAERTPDGITWFTRPELLPSWQRELCPSGYYDLGIAHGVPGVIAFLAQVCALDSERVSDVPPAVRAKARPLLDGAVAWLLAQECADSTAWVFPGWIGPGVAPRPSRVAWCYGDFGIAVALLVAARCVNKATWEGEALRLARHVAERPPEQAGVKDCGLCHGTAGVGHLFNRLFQATGETWLRDAARSWFQRTLKMRRPGEGIAGFSAFRPNPDGNDQWIAEPGILEGAAGVALALLAASTDIEPAWDRMMLVSIPHLSQPKIV